MTNKAKTNIILDRSTISMSIAPYSFKFVCYRTYFGPPVIPNPDMTSEELAQKVGSYVKMFKASYFGLG